MRRTTSAFVSKLFKSVRNQKTFSSGRRTPQHQFARFCRRNRIEPLESRILLAADFFRNGGTQYVDTSAEAFILQSSNLDNELAVGLDDPFPTQNTELVHSDASTAVSFGDTLRAIAVSHAEATALALTPMNTPTGVPTVSASGIAQGHGAGGFDTTWGDLVGTAANHGYALAQGEYQFRTGDAAQYTFHGTLFVGANGGNNNWGNPYESASAGLGAAITGLGPGCDSSVTMTYDAVNDIWVVDGTVAGVTISETGSNHYYYFECPIANLTQLSLVSSAGGGVGVSADGPGTSGSATVSFSAGAWGYVTETHIDTPPGDIDGDGDVDEDDFELWPQPAPGPAPNPNGGNGGSGYVDWIKAAGAIVVTTEVDENGENAADTSLREAIAIAAANPGKDSIVFAPWVETITLDDGQLTIASGNDVSIFSPDSQELTIDANGASRGFWIQSGVHASMYGVTIRDGSTAGSGGGILNSGDLVLKSVVVTDNVAASHGGGVYNNGVIQILNSTISENSALYGGGLMSHTDVPLGVVIENSAIINNDAGTGGGAYLHRYVPTATTGSARITNSTISGNEASGNGGGIVVVGGFHLIFVSSTNSQNRAGVVTTDGVGGGFWNPGSGLTLHNSIVAENVADYAYHYDITGSGVAPGSSYNLIGSKGDSGLTNNVNGVGNGNLVGLYTSPLDPGLAVLGDYGGATKTHALLVGSPALDVGSDAVAATYGLSFDQRRRTRNVDLPGVGTSNTVDIGAFEAGNSNTLIVTIANDENDGDLTASDLSLREAISLSAQIPGVDIIEFDDDVFAQATTIVLGLGELVIASDLTIQGPGKDLLTIDAAADNDYSPRRAIITNSNTTATFRGLTIKGGDLFDKGGGIYSRGDLTLEEVRVTDNYANYGGGIYHENGTLAIIRSEIYTNYAYTDAGGIYANSPEMMLIDSSTVSQNESDGTVVGGILISGGEAEFRNATISGNGRDENFAGGIYLDDAEVVFVNSTVAFNGTSSAVSAGIYATASATVTLHNTIVAKNIVDGVEKDVYGVFESSSSYNLIGLATGSTGLAGGTETIAGTSTAIDPRLKSLAYNGGITKTHALLFDSQAIDAGDNAVALTYGLDFDQRGNGFDRIVDWDDDNVKKVDIGAFELAFDEYYTPTIIPPPF